MGTDRWTQAATIDRVRGRRRPASTRLRAVLADRWPEGVVAAGGLFLTLATPWEGPQWLLLVRAAVGAGIAAATVVSWQRTSTRRRLHDDNEELRRRLAARTRAFNDAVTGHLATLATDRLAFTAGERISLYKHESGGFVLLGRHCLQPEFGAPSGRVLYPDGQGCLGAAWASTATPARAVAHLPDYQTQPTAYLAVCEDDWGMPAALTTALRMKSRSIAAYPLVDAAGRQRVGVIVFESVTSDGLDLEQLDVYVAEEAQPLSEFLQSEDAPSITAAAREGF